MLAVWHKTRDSKMESKIYGKLKRSPAFSLNSDDEYSSNDDSNYESLRDSNKYQEDEQNSDDDYQPRTRNSGKRLQTFHGAKLRNNSSSMDDGGAMAGKISVERMPTRKPDPKIFNRNALMARENRRRKKEQMETLERSMTEFRRENKKLRQMLKAKTHLVDKLKHERLYLKSIIANKSEIVTLLQSFKNARLPFTSSATSFLTGKSDGQTHGTALENHYTSEEDNDLLMDYPCSSSSVSGSIDDLPPLDNWETILNDETPFMEPARKFSGDMDNGTLKTELQTVSLEHNYFSSNSTTESATAVIDNQPGICLHVASGRVSLEFCASCHQNSQNAWIEEF